MSSAIPGRANPSATRRRSELASVAIAVSIGLVLLYSGFQGRQRARLQARVSDVAGARDLLQQKLDAEQPAIEQFLAAATGTIAARPPMPSLKVMPFVSALKARLEPFDPEQDRLPEPENLEIRLSRGTLANAERRFADALAVVKPEDELAPGTTARRRNGLIIGVLQCRGDALGGLGQWREALERYRKVLELEPRRLSTLARVADCQFALGNTNDALAACEALARAHHARGDDLVLQGKPGAAIEHYARAIAIQTRLVEQGSAPAEVLAASHRSRGQGFLAQKMPDAAAEDFARAILLLERLTEKGARSELRSELAECHEARGNALLLRGQHEAASEELSRAIGMLNQPADPPEPPDRREWANDLARSRNNRGVAWRAQGKSDAALKDFDEAANASILPPDERAAALRNPAARGAGLRPRVRMEILVEHAEQDIEVLLRTRFAGRSLPRESAVTRAFSLKNRGYVHLARGNAEAAIADFNAATGIYSQLVERDGEENLTMQLARSLSALAWAWATSDAQRAGSKARDYALRACELSEWKAFFPVATLAAAYAEVGEFAEAVRWQQRAVDLAPPKHQAELRSRLDLFRSGKPYRTPAATRTEP